jgi:hypothetical protein
VTRSRIVWLLVGVLLVAFVVWVARNTYWADIEVPVPLRGEARTNPFYAVQRFAEALGARTAWDRVLTVPPADSVIVLSDWHWNLSVGRREGLERWVESGGRLVVDGRLAGPLDDFERWSGIVVGYKEPDDDLEGTLVLSTSEKPAENVCGTFQEEHNGTPSSASHTPSYSMCNLSGVSFLTSNRNAVWAIRDASGIQAMRVQVGRGSVTVINAMLFRYRNLFDGDHARLFVAATQMRSDDDVHFLSEDNYPSLLALLWQYGAPVVVLSLALVALMLWRGAVRFGPLAAVPDDARRSLAEQIRGTGQFAMRHGGGDSLHAASVRALDEAAVNRIPRYSRLSVKERAVALAHLTGFDWKTLAAAVHGKARRAHELRNTIALVEAARRQILVDQTRSSHGTH